MSVSSECANSDTVNSLCCESTGMSNLPFSSHCQAHFDKTASVSVQHVRDISELIHSKNFLKMSNLETLLLLLKIQTFIFSFVI